MAEYIQNKTEVVNLGEKIIFNNGELEINFTDKSVKVNGKKVNLTGAEFKVLEVLAKRPNRVFSREDILNLAFGNSYDVFDRTIDTHIKKANGSVYYIRLIHGYHGGTQLKKMIYDEYNYGRNTKVIRIKSGANPGITDLVLREL